MITVNSREDFLREIKSNILTGNAAELGVFRGEFSRQIYDILEPYYLMLVDPFITNKEYYGNGAPTAYSSESDYDFIIDSFRQEIYEGKLIINRNYSHDAVKELKDIRFDFVYIDASHLYEAVKKDLNDWFPKLETGGILAGHDYINHIDFGVIQAVDEFCKEHNLEIFLFNKNGGDWAIKV